MRHVHPAPVEGFDRLEAHLLDDHDCKPWQLAALTTQEQRTLHRILHNPTTRSSD